jgi:pseudomonalisin
MRGWAWRAAIITTTLFIATVLSSTGAAQSRAEPLVRLTDNQPPAATTHAWVGAAPDGLRMERMILVLKPAPGEQATLDALVAAQQDSGSAEFRQWITPEEYGQRFGATAAGADEASAWLREQGFAVEAATQGQRAILFSGTARQVTAAFHTAMGYYRVAGAIHLANAVDPEIPAGLTPWVEGIVSLDDFRSTALHRRPMAVVRSPNSVIPNSLTPNSLPLNSAANETDYFLMPSDFYAIYDVGPLLASGIDGSGQAVAVAERSNIHLSDVRMFRSSCGLAANDPTVIVNGADPGTSDADDLDEATLDAEWAGAVAPEAAIDVVASASTSATDGVYLSALYAVDHNLAPVLSVSYGLCEATLGAAERAFLNSLWEQAAAQGITVTVGAGDSGAAGCDRSDESVATKGRAVNGVGSTAYDTAVGGTEFAAVIAGPATGYVPEEAWNQSAGGGLWATGGGASAIYAKPEWQSGAGVPAEGMRDVPDVALNAALKNGYFVYIDGELMVASGTSIGAAMFGAMMALSDERAGAREGAVNSLLYALARGETGAFHDVVSGNNSVPGVAGFAAGPGYDRATGLGSVDAKLLVEGLSPDAAPPSFSLKLSANQLSVTPGAAAADAVTSSLSGGFAGALTLSVSGLPRQMAAALTPAVIPTPGAGTSMLVLSAAANAVPGSYAVSVTASSGGMSKSAGVTVNVAGFTVTSSGAGLMLSSEESVWRMLRVSVAGGFSAPVSFRAVGLPAGVTAVFTPETLTAPGSGMVRMELMLERPLAEGRISFEIEASGGGQTVRLFEGAMGMRGAVPCGELGSGLNSGLLQQNEAGCTRIP